jgi:Na+/H+-dicarboxylate symporter
MKTFLFTFGALLLGIILGLFFQPLTQSIAFIGQIYVQLVKLLGIPLISFSLIIGIIESQKIKYSTIATLLKSSLLLTAIGLFSAFIVSYMMHINLENIEKIHAPKIILYAANKKEEGFFNFANLVVSTVMLSILIAIIIKYFKKEYLVHKKLTLIYKYLLKLISITLVISPFAILSLVSSAMLSSNAEVLLFAGLILLILLISYLLYYALIFSILRNKTGKPIFYFLKDSLDYQIAAFVSGSSKVALPKAINFLKLYTTKGNTTYKFILPLAATFNMQGLAIYMVVVSLTIILTFIGQPTLQQIITISLFSTIGGIGVAGLNGGALVLLPGLLFAVGVPEHYTVVIYLLEPMASGIRSATNLTSDVLVTLNVNNIQGKGKEK